MKKNIKVETIERLEDIKVSEFKKIKRYRINGTDFQVTSEGTSGEGLWTRLTDENKNSIIFYKIDNVDFYNKHF